MVILTKICVWSNLGNGLWIVSRESVCLNIQADRGTLNNSLCRDEDIRGLGTVGGLTRPWIPGALKRTAGLETTTACCA